MAYLSQYGNYVTVNLPTCLMFLFLVFLVWGNLGGYIQNIQLSIKIHVIGTIDFFFLI